MINRNASHHSGLRPGLSITLTEIVPVHLTPPLPVIEKPTWYFPGRVTGSMALGVNELVKEVPPCPLENVPVNPWMCPITSSPKAKSKEGF